MCMLSASWGTLGLKEKGAGCEKWLSWLTPWECGGGGYHSPVALQRIPRNVLGLNSFQILVGSVVAGLTV